MPQLEEITGRLDRLNGHMAELAGMAAQAQANERQRLSGVVPMRLPLLTGRAAGGVLAMGGDVNSALTGQSPVGPDLGWVWSVRHLVIEGLTASATTPDVVNILRNGRIIWQLNGNQFCQDWGRGVIVLYSGETLSYASVGTFAATGTITAHGMAEQVPAERVGKFWA